MEHRTKFDPLTDLSRQFYKLMNHKGTGKFDDKYDMKTKTWTFVKNRYESGSRTYQMQVDFMYLSKKVKDNGYDQYDITTLQKFINGCASELRKAV